MSTARKILIVDDDSDSAEALQLLLQLDGHNVRSSSDGGSALNEAAGFEPEVVILDIGLPDMAGQDVARELRAKLGSEALLVAATGSDQPLDQAGSQAPFDHWLVKPIDIARLRALVA